MNKIKEIIDYYFNIICLTLFIFLLTGIIVLIYRSFNDKSEKNESTIQNVQAVKEEPEEEQKQNDKIKVDVKGAVKNPDVYELENTSNVIDLINLAGGLKKNADTSNLNLSKKLEDQMVIKVFTKNELLQITKGNSLSSNSECTSNSVIINECNENNASIINSNTTASKNLDNSNSVKSNEQVSSGSQNTNKLISINSAAKEELMTLNSIGESKATAIIEYRNTNGPFKTIDDIKNVSGIGDALFEKIKSNITI